MRFFTSMGGLFFTLFIIIAMFNIALTAVRFIGLKLGKLRNKLLGKIFKSKSEKEYEDDVDIDDNEVGWKTIDKIYSDNEYYDSFSDYEG